MSIGRTLLRMFDYLVNCLIVMFIGPYKIHNKSKHKKEQEKKYKGVYKIKYITILFFFLILDKFVN